MTADNIIIKMIELIRSWDRKMTVRDKVSRRERIMLKAIGDYESEHGEPIGMSQISDVTEFPRPVVTQTVDKLEEYGLVQRVNARLDKRWVRAKLTESGRERYEREYEEMYGALERFVNEMGEEDSVKLIMLLNKANHIMEKVVCNPLKPGEENA